MTAGKWAGVGIAAIVVILFIVGPFAYWNRKRKQPKPVTQQGGMDEEKGSPELPDTSTARSSWRDSNNTAPTSELGADSQRLEIMTSQQRHEIVSSDQRHPQQLPAEPFEYRAELEALPRVHVNDFQE